MEYSQLTVYQSRSFDPVDVTTLVLTASELPADYPSINNFSKYKLENIVVDYDLILRTDLIRRQQVRLTDTATGLYGAITINHLGSLGNHKNILMHADAAAKFGKTSGDFPFYLTIEDKIVANSEFPEPTNWQDVADNGEMVEFMFDSSSGGPHDIFITAPHGGDFEDFSDTMAEQFMYQLRRSGTLNVTRWGLKGYALTGTSIAASLRWHITAVDYNPEKNYPLMAASVVHTRSYSYGFGFHGMSGNRVVEIGGRLTGSEVVDLQTVLINTVTPDVSINITAIGAILGENPRNITNRLTAGTGTIQLELSYDVRRDSGSAIADAMAHWYQNTW